MALPTPVAYWPFNEATGTTAADASGNGHPATLNHGTWDTSSLKAFGAAAFKNTDGGYGASFAAISLGTVYSIAFWMNGWDGANDGVSLSRQSTLAYVTYHNSTSILHQVGSGNFVTFAATGLTGAHHIVLTRNGTTVTVYKDATSLGSQTLGTNTALSLDTISGYADGTFPLVATLDDVRLYDVALTGAQVTELYALNADPTTAFTIAQTATGQATNTASVAVTVAAAPTIGQGVVVAVLGDGGATVTAVTDTAGQTYTLAKTQLQASNTLVHLWYCPVLTATATPFTVTASGASGKNRLGVVMTVTGVGAGLAVNQTAGTDMGAATVGATLPALTADDVLLVAACALAGSTGSITVGSTLPPPWTQQAERLALNPVTGEVDTRAVTAATGTTPSVSWALGAALGAASAIVAFTSLGPAPPTPSTGTPMNIANLGARTDENGALKVVAVTAGSGTSPLTPFANVRTTTDETGALRMGVITLNPPLGPLTDLANLRVCTDETGALLVATQTAGSTVGPLTNLGNLRARTDARGSLVVTGVGAGSLLSPLTPLLNLRGRSDENGALLVTGLLQSTLVNGIVSYWKLNEASGTRVDSVGTNHLTETGAVGATTGIIGNGAAFVGTTNLGCVNNPTLQTGAIDFTWAYWIKPNAGNQYILVKDVNGNEFQLGVFSGLRPGFGAGAAIIVSATAITTTAWAFVVGWREQATAKVSIQVNNGAVETSAATGTAVDLTQNLYLGYGGGIFYNGAVDEMGFWKRLLTPAERTTLYNSGAGLTYPFA